MDEPAYKTEGALAAPWWLCARALTACDDSLVPVSASLLLLTSTNLRRQNAKFFSFFNSILHRL